MGHTLNLVLADAARASKDAVGFFGHLQKLFSFFSGSTQRWSILKKYVDLTLKSLSDTRWESRCVQAVRFQVAQISEALVEVWQFV